MSPWPAPERDNWRPRSGILTERDLHRALREHQAWTLAGRRLHREFRFRDFDEAFAFVERLAVEAVDFGRHPDICIADNNRVRVTVASPLNAGITVGDLRLVRKVDALAERYLAQPAPAARPAAAQPALHHSHEHPLRA